MTFEERRTTEVRDESVVPAAPDQVEERRTEVVHDGDPVAPTSTYVEERRTTAPAVPVHQDRVVDEHTVAVARPTGMTMAARVVALIFGLIQGIIVLRIVFLLLDAREANGLVRGILEMSRPLVAPFVGIFQTDALQAGGSVLDIAAIAALVGWTVVELIILAFMRVSRPGEDV